MKILFEVEVVPISQNAQARLDAIGAALDVLVLHLEEMAKKLNDGEGILGSGEFVYSGGKALADVDGEKLTITVTWTNEGIQPQ